MKRDIFHTFRGVEYEFRFELIPPEYDVGIMGCSAEEITIHDIASGERMRSLEESLTEEEWTQLATELGDKASQETE